MARAINTLSMLIMLQFTLLLVEFLLGMYLNLFSTVSFPIAMGTGQASAMFSVLPHMVIGILVFIIALAIVIMSFRMGENRIKISTVLALLFILLAGLSGYMFAFRNGSDTMSFFMATGFVLALVIYMVPVSVLMRSTGHSQD